MSWQYDFHSVFWHNILFFEILPTFTLGYNVHEISLSLQSINLLESLAYTFSGFERNDNILAILEGSLHFLDYLHKIIKWFPVPRDFQMFWKP